MDRMIYLAMSAAKQMLQSQAVASHNLANANTTGFKADFDGFRSMPVFGAGYPTRAFVMDERPGIDFRSGTITHTGNQLDLAVNDKGFIAVQGPDGTEAYTRAGNLKLTLSGQLLTNTGEPVLGNNGPIALPDTEQIMIGDDGTISVRPLGQDATTLAQIDRIKLVNPPVSDLVKGADGLFRLRGGGKAKADAAVRVSNGALEQSNVSAVNQMISMIRNARNYEMAVKAMRTAQENDAAGARLLRLA